MSEYSVGICVGASTVSYVKISKKDGNINILNKGYIPHMGNPKKILSKFFAKFDLKNSAVIITGKKFRYLVNAENISEPEAVELAYKNLSYLNNFDVIASLGGENFIVYCFDKNKSLQKVISGNKCASGTGEFFLQQIGRMNLDINDAVKLSETDNPYVVSGRCSVFCKSDCTHALNKGIPKSEVVSGLSKMIADKTIELLAKQKSGKIIVIGGVSQNKSVVKFISDSFPDLLIPEEATYFEALGAAIYGLGKNSALDFNNIFKTNLSSYPVLPKLNENDEKVIFKSIVKSVPVEGDECILGLDVGSTTTKAVIIRNSDNALLASVYLRTNGNPVQASIDCYNSLKLQIKVPVNIIGLGTTGSGRHISALHALSKGVVNEIIAHAVAAAYFDKEVDTIFEIGGQDAKYTYLTNGVASDYAMNEACSAGTGSFLEESAKETLNIYYKDIAGIAFNSGKPLNFNDQCSAFISSDIKNASHESIPQEDIVAGLVYSICMNYINRVMGNRQVGKKIFMQGGVCYNKAVPYAMANLLNKKIIVPPEPGLMGAFGVALEIKNRINLNFLEKDDFKLDDLINRKFIYKNQFICAGGREKCDLKCSINLIEIEGKKYPFGGACSKYYNLNVNKKDLNFERDFVKVRQDLVFNKYKVLPEIKVGKSIGISRSFLTNNLFPLYYNFFTKLGFKIILSDKINEKGIDKIRSSYCYPVEISHGLFQDLLIKKPNYIFLPHITQMGISNEDKYKRTCVFVQGESYYLKSAFGDDNLPEIISPVIDFSLPVYDISKVFVKIGKKLGKSTSETNTAFDFAYDIWKKMLREFKEIGKKIINDMSKDDDSIVLVLFGRSYNSFATEANLKIPQKIASKGITIIPHDFIPSHYDEHYENMYWFSGQQILSSARFIKTHKNLFGVFITNFSCGPDSFIISYFRKIMGKKPSLTLELDSHSADVGIDTRIDAALDIINNYRELNKFNSYPDENVRSYGLKTETDGKMINVIDSKNNVFPITSPDIEVLIPSMGKFSSDAFSAVFRSYGIKSNPLPVPTVETLKYGRGLTTCKECLPFILTTGSLIEKLKNSFDNKKKYLFFMPHGYGPCRQGQYFISLKDIICNLKLENVGVLTLNDEVAFSDLGDDFFLRGWIAIMVGDVIHDIESTIQSLAVDKTNANDILNREWKKIIKALESGKQKILFSQLEESTKKFSTIKLIHSLNDAMIVSLIGEIYVRKEEFSRMDLIENIVKKGFVIKTAPISEYIYYSNYLIRMGIVNGLTYKEKLKFIIKDKYQRLIERKIKKILSKSGLVKFEMINIEKTMSYAKELISENLLGESILTTGLALREILEDSCGVISIGPFNCMPSRLSESILNKEMTLENKYKFGRIKRNGYPKELENLPFLFVESDGNLFPQITQSKIEVFMMQAEKLHYLMKNRPKH